MGLAEHGAGVSGKGGGGGRCEEQEKEKHWLIMISVIPHDPYIWVSVTSPSDGPLRDRTSWVTNVTPSIECH